MKSILFYLLSKSELKQNLKEIPQKEMNEKRTGRSLQSFAAPSTMPLQPRRGASDMLMSNFYRISEPLERCQSSSKSAMSTPLYHMSHTSTTTTGDI
ncbi:unnamed protein product [Rotaria magnacalcarata]|uniref:Uncharacterized protein n=1 Tax=Rotaria magnacalcarata TaxID=392030 RepID=A0A8S3JQP5_9BILA|nr:unnamed protein product [Rotaria magnacalcarata]